MAITASRFIVMSPLLMIVLLLSGCASYQYQIVQPPSVAGPVEQDPIALQWDPLEYHIADASGRLTLRIINLTGDPVTLLGERSYVVDPTGETRPMVGGTIAPNSRITMALPPQPLYTRAGPRFGVGLGFGTGYRSTHFASGIYGQRWTDYPREVYVQSGPHWSWTTGPVAMTLVYEHLGERIEHELLFDRIRVR